MENWLTELVSREQTDEERLSEALASLPQDDLHELGYQFDVIERPDHIEKMYEKVAAAEELGRSFAQSDGAEFEKKAIIGLLAGLAGRSLLSGAASQVGRGLAARAAGRLAGGVTMNAAKSMAAPVVNKAVGGAAQSALGGMAKDVAKNVAVNHISSGISNAMQRPAQAAPAAVGVESQGFKYAGIMDVARKSFGGIAQNASKAFGKGAPGTLGQKLTGFAVRNPGAALTAAGMVGGALMAPRDPQTGQKQYMKGALEGGAVGLGAHMLGGGNALRHAAMRPNNPILGEGVANYAREATRATGPAAQRAFAGGGIPAAASQGAASAGGIAPHAAPAAAPVMSDAQRAAHEAVAAGIKVPANMLHPDTNLMQGGLNVPANQMGEQMVGRQGFASRAGNWLAGHLSNVEKVASADLEKLAADMLLEMTPAQQLQFVAEVDAWEKTAWSTSPEGHKLDSSVYNTTAKAHEELARAHANYAKESPLKAALLGNDIASTNHRMMGRHFDYAARKHEKGRNAYNPFGGLLTPSRHEKRANRQTLTYDPSTKTFVRQHLTSDATMQGAGQGVIPAGTTEPVQAHQPSPGFSPGTPTPGPHALGPGAAQVHSLHGGNVLSSSPAPGVAARAVGTPPPVPTVARRAGSALSGMLGKPKLPSMAGAVSLVK